MRMRAVALSQGAAFAWGLAEATFFFIVPDVLLTWLALNRPRLALGGCVAALIGALLGGAVMWCWGLADIDSARAALDRVPAISPQMMQAVRGDLFDRGVLATFLGPLTGTPYKIFAVEAGALGTNLALFLLISVPARALRFIVLTLLAAGIAGAVGPRLSLSSQRAILTMLWVAFYIWYFATVPN